MDDEMKWFQADLLASVRQMKRGEAARRTEVELSPVDLRWGQHYFARPVPVLWCSGSHQPCGCSFRKSRGTECRRAAKSC